MLASRLWNWGRAQPGMQSQKKLEPFTVTDKIKLGLLGFLVLLVLTLIVVVPIINDNNNTNRQANNNNRVENKTNNKVSSDSPVQGSQLSLTKKETDLNDSAIRERVQRGEEIDKNLEAKYRFPVDFDWGAENISLLIPTKEWNSLPKEDQVNLSFYAEKLISDIRANPKPYVDKYWHFMHFQGNSAPAYNYESYIKAASNLCPTCWNIRLGKPIHENGKFDFEPDDAVVTGASADAFRQSVDKKLSQTSEEQDKKLSAEFAASMSSGEHLAKAKEVLSRNLDPNSSQEYKLGYYLTARKHLEVIPQNAAEFVEAQELLQEVARREIQEKRFVEKFVRQVKRNSRVGKKL
jgi:hypothetical protein